MLGIVLSGRFKWRLRVREKWVWGRLFIFILRFFRILVGFG